MSVAVAPPLEPAPGFRASRVISNLPDEAALDRFFARHGRLVNAPLAQWPARAVARAAPRRLQRALTFAQERGVVSPNGLATRGSVR